MYIFAPTTNPTLNMKKFLLASAFAFLFIGSFAQSFSDDFESYSAGSYLAQSSNKWSTWGNQPGTSQDVQISNSKAHSGSKSLYFSSTAQNGGPVDEVLSFGSVYTTGTFVYEMYMFVESNKVGYFNFQSKNPVGTEWAMDMNFKANGTFDIINTVDGTLLSGTYKQNQWINIKMNINLSGNVWELFLDNQSAGKFSNSNNQLASLDLFAMSGSSFYVDDVKYDYSSYSLPNLNCAVMTIGGVSGYLAGQSVTPTVTLRNVGKTSINGCDVKITYNGSNLTKTLSGINIASLGTYTATMNGTITLIGGSNDVVATVSNVNNAGQDGDASDDSKTLALSPIVPASNKIVIAEEATGTWCGWCPRGAVFLKTLTDKYGQFFQGIAVHNADPMTVTTYDGAMKAKVKGYPSALVDRGTAQDPSAMEADFLKRVLVTPVANITNGATNDANTNTLKVSLTTNFNSAVGSGYRIACVIVEDDVKGTSTGYDQHNYYAGGGSGVMGGFESKPNPVPASQMVYDHVARSISPGFDGQPNSFPNSVSSGSSYTHNFTFVLDPSWNTANFHIVGILIDPQGKIDNGSSTDLATAVKNGYVNGTVVSSLQTPSAPDSKINVYPNPTSGNSLLAFEATQPASTSIQVLAADGKVIYSQNCGQLSVGSYNLYLPSESWESGLYLIQVNNGPKSYSYKFIKQ